MTKPFPVYPLAIVWPQMPDHVIRDQSIEDEWRVIVADYESAPDSLFNAWLYLGQHPAFWELSVRAEGVLLAVGTAWYQSIELGVEQVGDDDAIWLEIGPVLWPGDPTWDELHEAAPGVPDRHVTVTAPTYEQAVVLAASIIHNQYGNDREFLKIPELEEGKWYG